MIEFEVFKEMNHDEILEILMEIQSRKKQAKFKY